MDSTKQITKQEFEKQVIENYGKLNPTKEETLDVWEEALKEAKGARLNDNSTSLRRI